MTGHQIRCGRPEPRLSAVNLDSIWSPDGPTIVFTRYGPVIYRVRTIAADGSLAKQG